MAKKTKPSKTKAKSERYVPKSYHDGSVTLKTLRRTLCAGFDPIHAVHLLQDLIRDSNIRTEPELPVPTEIRLLEDATVCVCTPERTYAEDEVRVFYDQPSPFRRGKRDHFDLYDWEAARVYLFNLRLRYIAEHGHAHLAARNVGPSARQRAVAIPLRPPARLAIS
jgi:hypothetical protein